MQSTVQGIGKYSGESYRYSPMVIENIKHPKSLSK